MGRAENARSLHECLQAIDAPRQGRCPARARDATFDRAKARQAARGLRQASRGIKLGGRLKIKDLIAEGRP